jgi:hypothetical protein
MNYKNILIGLLFILTVSIVAHLIFSWIGFVPSDDGFMLAYSRRILDGQIPFKDFLSAQNVGTPILWAPFVYFGGAYTFWITRFVVWFEFATIAWIWTSIVSKVFSKKTVNYFLKIALGLVAFLFTAHSFPPMVWYTIDGLFIYSIAIILCQQNNKYTKILGYMLIGTTYLIKQNFIFLLPVTIFLLGDWKSKRYWVALLAPVVLFYSFFFTAAGIFNTLSQTTSRTEFLQTSVKAFVAKFTFPWGIMLGFLGISFLSNKQLSRIGLGGLILVIPLIYSIFYFHNSGKFVWDASFLLFGTVLGITVFFLKTRMDEKATVLFLALMAAWTVAISGGYNTPVFASGILFLCIFFPIYYFLNLNTQFGKLLTKILFLILILCLPVIIASFYYLRVNSIYGETHSAKQLTYAVGKVFPGGNNIFTSKEVYEKLLDLKQAELIAKNNNKEYAILPADAGLWVQSKQENPLPMDFPFIFNNQKALINPMVESIKNERGKTIIIVDKASLNEPVDNSASGVFPISLVPQKYYQKIGETKYFVLYK